MIVGLYAAATGMRAMEARHDVIANNVANAATPGFRRQFAVQKGFDHVLLGQLSSPFRYNIRKAPGGGAEMIETFTDTSGGPVVTTGNSLDVALEGPAFVAVETPWGERFTRQGQFTVDVDGELVTPDGHKVQNAQGESIAVDGKNVEISEEGDVWLDGQRVGQIRMVEFDDPHLLTREGATLYAASDEAMARSAPAASTRLIQSGLEQSNVQMAREMTDMMIGLRAYSANQKVISSIEETLARLIDQVGAPL